MIKKLIIGLTIAAVIGAGVYAFAHQGQRFGNQGWMHGGSGMHHGYHGGPGLHHGYFGGSGYDYPGNLKDEDLKAFDEQRSAFIKETEDLRRDLYSKELELRSELIKDNPDVSRAVALQKDISELQSNLDQRRLEHMIKMRKINPNVGGEFMGGYHMGYGNSSSDPCWR